jgi:pimeloyl-ACP methyl ester carboxylesterase
MAITPRARWVAILCTALLPLTSVAGARASTAPSAADAGRPRITWVPCPAAPAVRCGVLKVPLDWSNPRGATVDVAVARRPADDPRRRVGTLFYNPGGPGDGAAEYVRVAEKIFSPALRARFDLVGMDPRGTGASVRATCSVPPLTPEGTLFPRSEKQFEHLVRHNRRVGLSCLRQTGALLRHMDTVTVARDHEALRAALGVRQVSWFGVSYGTQVAANYAELFPGRVRAMALDAALEHSRPEGRQVEDEARAAEDSFNRFARWCRTAATCALKGQDVGTVYDRLVRSADRRPIPVPGAMRGVTGEDIRMGAVGLLRFKEPSIYGPGLSWAGLSRALRGALTGDASAFAMPPVSAPQDGVTNLLAIACLDYDSQIHSYRDLRQRIAAAKRWAPHLQGASETWQVNECVGRPLEPTNPPRRLDVRGVSALIVHATHDPSTAYPWAHGLASQIRGSVVLTREGDGHTSYQTSACARRAIDAYLLGLVRPEPSSTSGSGPVCS